MKPTRTQLSRGLRAALALKDHAGEPSFNRDPVRYVEVIAEAVLDVPNVHEGYGRDAAVSRDEWLASERGQQAQAGSAKGKYLGNRLESAYLAGYEAGHARAFRRILGEPDRG